MSDRRLPLVVTLTLALLAAPLGADAQQAGRVYRIGYLGFSSALADRQLIEAFRAGLREHGWVEGQNVVVEYRWAEGKSDRLRDLASELVGLKVDVIVAGGAAIRAAKETTKTIPIIMTVVGDPLEAGFIASYARPGGNITGLAMFLSELNVKRLQFLKEALPGVSRVAVLIPAGRGQAGRVIEDAARQLGVTVDLMEVREPQDFEPAFVSMARGGHDAALVVPDPLTFAHRARIATLAAAQRLPAVYGWREYVEAGGLLSYGPSVPDLHRRAAAYVDKLLRGANPRELPVEQPTKFEIVINMKTARALGLTIPPSLLLRADHVVE